MERFRSEDIERLCEIYGTTDGVARCRFAGTFIGAMPRGQRIIPPPEINATLCVLLKGRDGHSGLKVTQIDSSDQEVAPGFASEGKTFGELKGLLAHRSRMFVVRNSLYVLPNAVYLQPAYVIRLAA